MTLYPPVEEKPMYLITLQIIADIIKDEQENLLLDDLEKTIRKYFSENVEIHTHLDYEHDSYPPKT